MYKKCFNKKILAVSVISLFFLQMLYVVFEPTVTLAANTDTTDVVVTLNVEAGIAITADNATATMAPDISITNNKSTGASVWTVTTNNVTGYDLTVNASDAPALANGIIDSFADYTDTLSSTWTVPATSKQFGFSVVGADADTTSFSAGVDCLGDPLLYGDPADTLLKYEAFNDTTPITIASSDAITSFDGTDTNICFGAEQNGVFANAGTYTATITATATVK